MIVTSGPAVEPEVEVGREDLAAITSDVWTCFLGEELHDLPEATAVPDEQTVLASVGITGAWGGHVLLELPVEAARAAAVRMLGLPPGEEVAVPDVVDALGELSNMVGGNVKSLVPAPSHLGLPMVVAGHVAPAAGRDTVEICRADLGWAGTTVRVSVWAKTNHRNR